MCVINNDKRANSIEFDSTGNPFIDQQNPARCTAVIERGEDGNPVRARVKVSVAAWDKARAALHGEPMQANATREELMA